MTIDEVQQKAEKYGYDLDLAHEKGIIPLLDPLFWQSFGKAMGWIAQEEWRYHWHAFIDFLASGKTIEEYFLQF